MKYKELFAQLTAVTPGTKLKITFCPGEGRKQSITQDTAVDLIYFSSMGERRELVIADGSQALLTAVIQSRYWDSDQNRTFTVEVGKIFDAQYFSQKLRDIIEKVEIVQ